jgi:uncharacterized membrane protein/glutaredoxin
MPGHSLSLNFSALDRVLFGCYAVGCLTCAYLTVLSFSADAGHFCELAGTDCVAVIRSNHGRILGLSIATLGLGFFFGQAVLLVIAGNRSAAPAVPYLLLGAGATGLLFSGYLIYVMRVALGQDCLACYGAHTANAAASACLVARVIQMRRKEPQANRQSAAQAGGLRARIALSILSAAVVIFGLNWMEARHQLSMERARLKENLDYYSYRYETAQRLELRVQAGDAVVGERAVAPHQIVLFYKHGCGHCQAAREKLTAVVKRHENAVHLILKDVQRLTDVERARLKEQISKLPAVFVNGKHADGWEVPGFLDRFTLDCGC